jgi:hypothetical protein
MKQQFDGEEEKELPPTHCDRKIVFEMVRNICVVFRKGVKEKSERERKMPQSRMRHLNAMRIPFRTTPSRIMWFKCPICL